VFDIVLFIYLISSNHESSFSSSSLLSLGQPFTVGCETVDMTLRRNGLGQLGFHVRLDGTVAEVRTYTVTYTMT